MWRQKARASAPKVTHRHRPIWLWSSICAKTNRSTALKRLRRVHRKSTRRLSRPFRRHQAPVNASLHTVPPLIATIRSNRTAITSRWPKAAKSAPCGASACLMRWKKAVPKSATALICIPWANSRWKSKHRCMMRTVRLSAMKPSRPTAMCLRLTYSTAKPRPGKKASRKPSRKPNARPKPPSKPNPKASVKSTPNPMWPHSPPLKSYWHKAACRLKRKSTFPNAPIPIRMCPYTPSAAKKSMQR